MFDLCRPDIPDGNHYGRELASCACPNHNRLGCLYGSAKYLVWVFLATAKTGSVTGSSTTSASIPGT